MIVHNRDLDIYCARSCGATYTSISAYVGLSAARVTQIYRKVARILERSELELSYGEKILSTRVRRCLFWKGYDVGNLTKQHLVDWLNSYGLITRDGKLSGKIYTIKNSL